MKKMLLSIALVLSAADAFSATGSSTGDAAKRAWISPKIDRRADLRGKNAPNRPQRTQRIQRNARRGRSVVEPALPATSQPAAPHYASPEVEKWTTSFNSAQEQADRAAIQLESVKRYWADLSIPAGFRIASPAEQAARRDLDSRSPGSYISGEQRRQRDIKQAEQRLKMATDSVLYAKEMLDKAHKKS